MSETAVEETTETVLQPTAAELDELRNRVRRVRDEKGIAGLHNLPPLAISATLDPRYDLDDPTTLFAPAIEVKPVMNPLLEALLHTIGFERSSETGFRIGAGEKTQPQILQALLEALPQHGVICDPAVADKAHRKGLGEVQSDINIYSVQAVFDATTAGRKLDYNAIQRALFNSGAVVGRDELTSSASWRACSGVVLSTNGGQIYVKVISAGPDKGERGGELRLYEGAPNLNLLKPKSVGNAVKMGAPEALALLKAARLAGFPVVAGAGIAELKQKCEGRLIATREVGSPGLGKLLIPASIVDRMPAPVQADLTPMAAGDHAERAMFSYHVTDAVSINKIAKGFRKGDEKMLADPRIADVVKMAAAKPNGKRDPLRPYQDEAASIHLATDYGYVNACSPGLGKTVMSLQAMRESAAAKRKGDGYRALVVCPAAIRGQWASETKRFFPEANVAAYQGKELIEALDAQISRASRDGDPALVVVSFNTMVSGLDKLLAYEWDDLICDEATVLSSTASARSQALWQLRRVAARAVPMTGTPYNKSLDDIGRLLAWARDEEDAFHGNRLAQRFDMDDPDDVEAFWNTVGPCLFRRDRSEIADQLPHIETEVITLTPEPAELRLAEGARKGLKRIYERLVEKLEIARELHPDDPDLAAADEEIRKVRGAVLGGITSARQAASDPAALRGSGSSGVALLDAAKLVEPAIRTGGTKRKLICGMVEDAVGQGDAVLIFTDFAKVATNLRDDLAARGLRVGTFTGANSGKRRDANAADFQAGNLDVLILTGAGREGLNLQRASVLVQYDLPWVPSQIIQRIGRASRFGSTSDTLQVIVPIMAGTIEERVAAVLVPRAVQAIAALDSPRGVKATDTEAGIAVSGLAEAVPDGERAGEEGAFSIAEQILGD